MPKVPDRISRAESIDGDALANQARQGGSTPTSALDFVIEEVDIRVAQWLNSLWHSVLPITEYGNLVRNTKYIAYVALFCKHPYAVAIWTTPVAANRLSHGFEALELRRFAIHNDAPKNTASRMLAVMFRLLFKKWPEASRVVSYQAVDHHDGTIYKAAGWKQVAFSESETWHVGEKRADMQTTSPKIRWEKKFPMLYVDKSPPPKVKVLKTGTNKK